LIFTGTLWTAGWDSNIEGLNHPTSVQPRSISFDTGELFLG